VDYKTSTKITAIDAKAKALTSESGDTISYEKLIYATGARVCSANPALTDQPMSQERGRRLKEMEVHHHLCAVFWQALER
jgi:NADH dehydrogenase FAD-containing subunit